MTGALIVNLEEFAELCRITPETMRVHLRTVEGEPVWLVRKGDRGRGYEIEARGGVAWWQKRCDDDANASAEKKAQLAQLRFEILGGAADGPEELMLSGRQRKEEIEAAFKGLEFRKAMGGLIEKAELQHVLTGACVDLRRRLGLCAGEFAIVAGLEPDQVRPLDGIIARAVDAFVTALAPIGVDQSTEEVVK
jgi:hypothetical protein